jgi:16S rRNA G1207 methylase RsmC
VSLDAAALARLREDIVFDAELMGRRYRLHTTWGLFSPRGIDEGTRLLLDRVQVAPDARVLDLGCGYGAIGLALAGAAAQGRATLVDKDYVAVDYARANAARNGLDHVEVLLSNGFSQIRDRRFDLIASNVPAKVGKELLQILLHDAHACLAPGGRIYLVTVTGLRQFIARHLREVFGNYDKLKQGPHYTVAMAERGS